MRPSANKYRCTEKAIQGVFIVQRVDVAHYGSSVRTFSWDVGENGGSGMSSPCGMELNERKWRKR